MQRGMGPGGVVCEEEILVHEKVGRRKTMKRLSCRKCEGHGIYAILKGHAPSCPFNDCDCETCQSVMHMRASALVRRFRNKAPKDSHAVLKTIRSKNGNKRLKIVAKSGRASPNSMDMTCFSPTGSTSSSSATLSPSPTLLSPFSLPLSLSPSAFTPVLPYTPLTLPTFPSPFSDLFLQQLLLSSLVA